MVPDNYLEYIDKNNVLSACAEARDWFIKANGGNIVTGTFVVTLPQYQNKIETHLPILESDIKNVQGRIDKAESRIKQYKRDIAILKGEEIPVDKIELYEAEEKAKEEAAVNAEKQKNNVIVGVIILAIFAFIIYAVKKKQK